MLPSFELLGLHFAEVLRIIERELQRALKKTAPERWAEHAFFQRHRHFIQFDFMATSETLLAAWWAWCRQHLIELPGLFEALHAKAS